MKQILLYISFLLLLINTNILTTAQNFDNLQTIQYTTESKKNIELNLVLPIDWKVEKRINNQEIMVKKDDKNFININITDYVEKPKNTICYNKLSYTILDSKILRRNSVLVDDNFTQEYYFRNSDAFTQTPVYLNYTTTQEDLNKIEVEGSKAFYIKQGNNYEIKLPQLGELYEFCNILNNIGPVNYNNNNQYAIKSHASDEANQKIVDNIIISSNLGNNLIPDKVNQQTPITAISKTVGNTEKSNIYIFFAFFGLLTAFSFILVYMTRLRKTEK